MQHSLSYVPGGQNLDNWIALRLKISWARMRRPVYIESLPLYIKLFIDLKLDNRRASIFCVKSHPHPACTFFDHQATLTCNDVGEHRWNAAVRRPIHRIFESFGVVLARRLLLKGVVIYDNPSTWNRNYDKNKQAIFFVRRDTHKIAILIERKQKA